MAHEHLRKFPARWDFAYWPILGIIFVLAIRLRAELPLIPFLDFDSWDYLSPAMSSLVHGAAAPTYREFLYPWLLEQLLRIQPNFAAISGVQHGMGILAGGFLILAWHRMRVFLPQGLLTETFHRLGGLIIATLYLFSTILVLDEHKIRPEAFFIFDIALCLWLATEFSRKVFRFRFDFQAGIFAACLIFLSSAAYYLRPYFGFGVACALLPVFIALICRPGNGAAKVGSVICGLGLVAGLLVWPDHWVHSAAGRTGNKYFLAESLFCSSAEIVYDVVQKDAHVLSPSDSKRPIVENFLRSMNQVIGHPSKAYAGFIRFDPDDVRYLGPCGELIRSLNHNESEIKNFYSHYYLRAWKEYPVRMIEKITAQLWFFFSPPRYRIYDPEKDIDVRLQLRRSKQVLLENRPYRWAPFQDYTNGILSLQEIPQSVHMPAFAVLAGHVMNPLYSVSLLLVLIVAAILQFGWMKLKDPGFKTASLWALYLFSYNIGMSFTIAFVFVMGQRRYTFGQTPLSAMSQCFALVLLVSFISVFIQSFKEKPPRNGDSGVPC
ncbi:MAG: hypothetical protein C5B47_05300 [Verrucomicrobia bacterium]|nr:MAG: hypothetical protein C5B47_05300 [Verrucomicrobiota bacterium]